MIKPVEIGLRIAAILARTIVSVLTAPILGVSEILSIVGKEILTPFVSSMDSLKQRLEEAA